jgi:putative transposase
MILSRRFALRPTHAQRKLLAQAAGCARFAWNWGLAKKQAAWALRRAALASGTALDAALKVPTAIDLHRELNRLKKNPVEDGGVPWMRESSKAAPQEALRDLDLAFAATFRRLKADEKPGFPKFHGKRPGEGHFRVTGAVTVTHGHVTLPRIGPVRIMPGDRGYADAGKYASASIVQDHGEWFVSVRVESTEAPSAPEDALRVGIDLGVRKLAVLSDGTVFANPRAIKKATLRLKRAQRALSRKVKGSGRRRAARLRLARQHVRVANLRADATHKMTTAIACAYPVVVIEDLTVRNMTRRARGRGRASKAGLNRAILDANFGEIRRQLDYKMALRGGRVLVVHPAYTSQTCSRCGERTDCGSCETFTCLACGFTDDRDLNASVNIRDRSYEQVPNVAASWPETQNARGAAVRHRSRKSPVLASMKRESKHGHV